MGNNTMQPNLRPKINIFFDWSIHRMGRRLKIPHRETTLSVQLLALKQKMNQLEKKKTLFQRNRFIVYSVLPEHIKRANNFYRKINYNLTGAPNGSSR